MTTKKKTTPAVKDYVQKLQAKLAIKNINAVPKIDKIVVNFWIWSLATRKWQKDFSELEKNLIKITGQKPHLLLSKKAISNFKLREWMPVMLRVTLRRNKAESFFDKLVKVVLPRIRDFSWVSTKKFDSQANLNMWINNYNIFPELNPDDITIPMWMQITIVTTTTDPKQAKALLESLWLVFLN